MWLRKNIILYRVLFINNRRYFRTFYNFKTRWSWLSCSSHTRKAIKEKSNTRGDERTKEIVWKRPMVFCTDLNFFFKQLDKFFFFSIAIKLIFFSFLPSQNRIFVFNALYKGVSQYSFLDAMHIAHIYYIFPCYISHLYM